MSKHFLFRSLILSSLVLLAGAGCVSFSSTDPSTSGPAGVFVSSNGGDAWQQLAAFPQATGVQSIAGVSVYRIFDDPQDPDTMYLTTRGQGMFYTYDNGNTWQRSSFLPLQNGFVYAVAVHPKDKCLLFATNGTQVFKSTDCSRTWDEVYREGRTGVNISSLAFSFNSPYEIYIAEGNGDILRSADGGQSWTTVVRYGSGVVRIEADRLTPDRLYLITKENGLYRSDDKGQTWSDLTNNMQGISGAKEYRSFLQHPKKPNIIYWVSTYGIIYSLDAGQNWRIVDLITAPGSVNIYGFSINPSNDKEMFYTATEKDLSRSTFYKTIDGGVNWTTKKMPTSQIPTFMRVHLDKGYIYVGFSIPPKK